jgi:hypothetical protein
MRCGNKKCNIKFFIGNLKCPRCGWAVPDGQIKKAAHSHMIRALTRNRTKFRADLSDAIIDMVGPENEHEWDGPDVLEAMTTKFDYSWEVIAAHIKALGESGFIPELGEVGPSDLLPLSELVQEDPVSITINDPDEA